MRIPWAGAWVRRVCLLSTVVFCTGMQRCSLEEDLTVQPDGSGSYKAHVEIPSELAQGAPDIKQKAQQQGFTLVQESDSGGALRLVFSKDFRSVSDLSDGGDTYELTLERHSPFRMSYRFTHVMKSSPAVAGFSCSFRATLPASITHASGGSISGRTVLWDCGQGGTLTADGSGLAFSLQLWQKVLLLALTVGGGGILVTRRRKTGARASTCPKCGARVPVGIRFCQACGTELNAAPAAPEAAGGAVLRSNPVIVAVMAVVAATIAFAPQYWSAKRSSPERNAGPADQQTPAAPSKPSSPPSSSGFPGASGGASAGWFARGLFPNPAGSGVQAMVVPPDPAWAQVRPGASVAVIASGFRPIQAKIDTVTDGGYESVLTLTLQGRPAVLPQNAWIVPAAQVQQVSSMTIDSVPVPD